MVIICEQKKLTKDTIILEDIKVRKLVEDAGFTGNYKTRIIHDIMITGISCEKIKRKIIREGSDITLAIIMELSMAGVATQHHLSMMQEPSIASIYLQYGHKKRIPKNNCQLSTVMDQISGSQQSTVT